MTSLNAEWFWPAGAPEGAIESFGYDARGLRVEAMEEDAPSEQTFYVYGGSTLLGEVAAGANEPTPVATAAYTWGADGLVSERLMNQPGGVPDASLWYHFGPQGETRQLTDSTGSVADAYSYTAYGAAAEVSGYGDPNPFRYGGQFGYYAPLASNFYLCGLRWYDADAGRFLSRDPIGYDGGDNLYAYCGGDPVNWADPDGTQSGTQLHHSFPKFLGGDPKQPLTPMRTKDHGDIHRDINAHLKNYRNAEGKDMCPRKGNKGEIVRNNFSPEEREDAMGTFYRNAIENPIKEAYHAAARDFLHMFPKQSPSQPGKFDASYFKNRSPLEPSDDGGGICPAGEDAPVDLNFDPIP